MDGLPGWIEPIVRNARVRLVLALACAVTYYLLVVAGEIGRTGSIPLTAVPAALSLIWFRTRPPLALGLSAAGLLSVVVVMVNGSYVQAVTQQSAVLVVIFGGCVAADPLHRRLALALSVLTALLSACFALGRFVGADSGFGWGFSFAVELIALSFLPVVLGLATRFLIARGDLLGSRLDASRSRELEVAKDVAAEQERNRVAREVHDVVAHSLAVVIAQADGARYAAAKDPASVGTALDAISDTARSALGEVRTLLHHLRHSQGTTPPTLNDVDALIDSMRDLGLAIDLSTFGRQRVLGDVTQLAVFRLVQEALTNALRHGDAGQPVTVEYDWGERTLTIVVTNAIPKTSVPQIDGSGHGIPGMRERALLAGGDLTVGLGTRGLFRVRATVPAPAEGGRTALLQTAPAAVQPVDA